MPYADLTNPQTLNQYAYVHNNPMTFGDPDGHDGCCTLMDVLNFAAGAANAYGSDNLLGVGRMEQTTPAGKIGQAFGDAAATVSGVVETLSGVGGEVGGVALDATGVGAVAGVPINIASAAVIAHGGTTTATSFSHLLKDANESAGSKPYEPTPENQENMKKGEAPVGNDGHKVELHHDGQQTNSPLKEMTRTDHRGKGNFTKNHQNTGQKKSQVDRAQADKDRAAHWKAEHEKLQDQK